MPIQNKPDEKIFASNAKPREVDNFPDINRGWGFTFEQTGGIPTMEHFNALFKRNDEHLMYLLQRGVPEWSSTIDYPQGACVQYQGKTYRSLTQNRSQTPATGSQHWTLWGLTIADIPEVRPASLTASGITQLDNAINSNAEDRAATPKAVKQVNDKVERNARDLNERIPNSKKSDAVNSNSSDTVATSRAVKTAYDLANSKQSPATTLAGYGITDFVVRYLGDDDLNDVTVPGMYGQNLNTKSKLIKNYPIERAGSLVVTPSGNGVQQEYTTYYGGLKYVRGRLGNGNWDEWKRTDNKDGLPIGSVVAFPKEIANPQGFLRCDGTTFSQNTYPDLYRVLGNKNRLPNLQRSDVGMMAYFPQDNIPNGWLTCNGGTISSTDYPELHRYLNNKYGANKLPNAEDRFIRNAGNGLRVGEKQKASVMAVNDNDNAVMGVRLINDDNDYRSVMATFGLDPIHSRDYANVAQVWSGNATYSNLATEDNTEINPYHQVGGTRPKSIIFKLCIKAKNSLDDVQFWIKAFGEVTNAGTLDAGRLAQNLQDKADRAHTHTVSQITDFAQGVAGIFAQNMGENGWTKLPNGLILQWGRARDSVKTLFNIAFPNNAFMLVATCNLHNFDNSSVWTAYIHNNREFTLFEGAVASEDYAYWFAIGH